MKPARIWLARPAELAHSALATACERLLDAEEQRRLARTRGAERRRELLAAHALLRVALAHGTSLAPAALRFRRGRHGRPEIASPACARALRFSVSHTRDLVACAVVERYAVGVDIEPRARDLRAIAVRLFAPDELEPARRAAPAVAAEHRVALWTLKEAHAKARGGGLLRSLRRARFAIGAQSIAVRFDPLLRDREDRWQLWSGRAGDSHRLALAIRRGRAPDLVVESRLVSFADFDDGAGIGEAVARESARARPRRAVGGARSLHSYPA